MRPIIPCALMDFFTTVANEFRCILHGFPSHPALTMPICGFSRSSLFRPMAWSIACAPGCVSFWVTCLLYLFNSFITVVCLLERSFSKYRFLLTIRRHPVPAGNESRHRNRATPVFHLQRL